MMDTLENLYQISYELRPEYFYAYAKGDLSDPQTRIACWNVILQRCRREDRDRLLVVQDSPPNKDAIAAFTGAAGVVELGVQGLKIAFVDPDPDEFENNKFCEVVARNRGANAKLFLTEDQAHAWLVGDSITATDADTSASLESTHLGTVKR
jgi:hypothetical protein